MQFSPRRLTQEWEINAPVSRVWDVLAHTDKLNRAVGLPPVHPSPYDNQELGRRVDARLYGVFPMSWIEYPFEWVRERSYSVRRDYSRGPLARFRGGLELYPSGTGSRVRLYGELTPRNLVGWVVGPFFGRKTLQRTWDYCRRAVHQNLQTSQESQSVSAPVRPSPISPISSSRRLADMAELQQRADRLGKVPSLDKRVIAELIRHLSEAGDEDVIRMQPYALADRWAASRHEALRVFLHATRAGLLNLVWDLMCPNCRVPKAEAGSLSLVTRQFHCDTCGIDYEANLDRYVELRFGVHPAVRSAQDAVYCFGGPHSAPHILVQHLLQPGEERDLSATLQNEAYRIRTLLVNRTSLLLPNSHEPSPSEEQTDRLLFRYGNDGWEQQESVFYPGTVHLRWANRFSKPIAVVLERVRWDDQAVTAAEVTALQEFRDLFGSEVLAPGQEIGVESVAILFSDLKGSTRLYEEAGDAPAYGQVRRHFEFLKERIGECRGAVVKTIGDAVMAVFYSPADALRCGLAVQRDIIRFNETLPNDRAFVIKLGMHHGPAIAINANGRLDYFGRTVNLAARILRESQGGDVVLVKDTIEDPRLREVMNEEKATVVAEWSPTLRGLAEPLTLCRVVPA